MRLFFALTFCGQAYKFLLSEAKENSKQGEGEEQTGGTGGVE